MGILDGVVILGILMVTNHGCSWLFIVSTVVIDMNDYRESK